MADADLKAKTHCINRTYLQLIDVLVVKKSQEICEIKQPNVKFHLNISRDLKNLHS